MKINLFSVPVHITNIDTSKIILKSEEFKKEWVSNTTSSFGFRNKLTVNSYNYLMDSICNLLHPHLNGKTEIQLLNIWENKYVDNDFQENHIHTRSHFSFIIYVSGNKSETVFFAPHKYILECFYDSMFYTNSYDTELRPGQIIIFPSFLEHMVKKNSGTVTYAGNLKMIIHENKQTIYKKEEQKDGNY
jgi:hypothetical protein